VDRTVQQQQQQPQPPPQQQQQQGLPIEKKAPALEVGGARKAASGREPEPESEMALRHQTARREAVEQDHTVLTAVTSVRSPGEGGGGGAGAGSGPVDSTHGGSGMPPVGEAGSLTGGGAAIVSSETHARLREHTGGTEGTTAAVQCAEKVNRVRVGGRRMAGAGMTRGSRLSCSGTAPSLALGRSDR
jgi:hypothetical protein